MPASRRVVNKVEICQLFAIRLRVTSNVDEYFANHNENVINLSMFVYIFWQIIRTPVDNSLFAANYSQCFIRRCVPPVFN